MSDHDHYSALADIFIDITAAGTCLVVAFVLFLVAKPNVTQALGFEGYGGLVDSFVPNLTAAGLPNPTCPYYSVITNFDPTDGLPPEFGVFMPPALIMPLYDYNNLFIPGAWVVGALIPIPNVACLAPIPVYPLFPSQDGPFYLTGTSGT